MCSLQFKLVLTNYICYKCKLLYLKFFNFNLILYFVLQIIRTSHIYKILLKYIFKEYFIHLTCICYIIHKLYNIKTKWIINPD